MAVLTVFAAVYAITVVRVYHYAGHLGLDSHAYWVAGNSEVPWNLPPQYVDAFLYSPVVHQLLQLPAQLPWPVFAVLWSTMEAACFVWLTRDVPFALRVPVLLLCTPAVLYGNIIGMLGVMMVLGMKRPGVWALAFLTKVTIGAAGIIWFAARGEWRKVGEIVLVVCVLVTVSWVADSSAWHEWLSFLTSNTNAGAGAGVGRWVRFVVFAVLVWVAARRSWGWVLPLGLMGFSSHASLHAKDLALVVAIPQVNHQASRACTRGMTSSP